MTDLSSLKLESVKSGWILVSMDREFRVLLIPEPTIPRVVDTGNQYIKVR